MFVNVLEITLGSTYETLFTNIERNARPVYMWNNVSDHLMGLFNASEGRGRDPLIVSTLRDLEGVMPRYLKPVLHLAAKMKNKRGVGLFNDKRVISIMKNGVPNSRKMGSLIPLP